MAPAKPASAPTRHAARKTAREARLEVALAEREAMRRRGEVPPLPDPAGRDRRERALRYVAYEDARRRRDAGLATPEELAYLDARRTHLSTWRKQKNARRQRRAAMRAGGTPPGGDEGSPVTRPRLRGPEDLRAFIEGREPG
jgi:hypothetical protein